MTSGDREIILASGEAITAAELFEGFVRLAISNAPPLLTKGDAARAVLLTAFDALDWAEERGMAE